MVNKILNNKLFLNSLLYYIIFKNKIYISGIKLLACTNSTEYIQIELCTFVQYTHLCTLFTILSNPIVLEKSNWE